MNVAVFGYRVFREAVAVREAAGRAQSPVTGVPLRRGGRDRGKHAGRRRHLHRSWASERNEPPDARPWISRPRILAAAARGPGGGRRRRPRRRGASLCGRGASFRPRSWAAVVAVPGRAQGGGTWTCPPSRRGGPRGLVVGRAGGRGRAVAVFPRCRLPQGRTARPSRECRGVRERRGTAASAPRRAPREAAPCHALLSQPRSRHRAERPVRVPRREACQASCCSQWGRGAEPPHSPKRGDALRDRAWVRQSLQATRATGCEEGKVFPAGRWPRPCTRWGHRHPRGGWGGVGAG